MGFVGKKHTLKSDTLSSGSSTISLAAFLRGGKA